MFGCCRGQEDFFARFTYNGDVSLASEEQRRNVVSTFTRRFVYKSVGFLCKLPDPFLEQEIDHTDGGYEHISRITFKAHWATDNWRLHDANDAMDQLGETGKKYWELYLTALETAGYLSSEPIRELYHRAENGIPLVCTCGGFSWRLANWLEKKRQPATYEHSYAYGNHRQLVNVKAKYFASGDIHQPLQPDSSEFSYSDRRADDQGQNTKTQTHRQDRIGRDVRTDKQHPHDGWPSRLFRLRRQRRTIGQIPLGPGRRQSNQNDPRLGDPSRAGLGRPSAGRS